MRAGDAWRGATRPAALVLAVASGLSGCGQTGPLYLPDDGSATVITRPGPATTGNESAAPPASSEAGTPSVPDAAPGAAPGTAPDAAPPTPTTRPPARR